LRIEQLAEIGVVEGRTPSLYEPDGTVTRGQMASFIVRAVSWNHTGDIDAYTPIGDVVYFTDVDGTTHGDTISAGFELWLFEGRAPGQYEPGLDVRRDTMATFLTRALDLVHPNIEQSETYVLSPMTPQTAPTGEPIGFSVDASRAEYLDGAEPIPGPVGGSPNIALFPCENVTAEPLPVTFADDDTDRIADDIAQSDQGSAYISEVNGEPTEGQVGLVRSVPPRGRADHVHAHQPHRPTRLCGGRGLRPPRADPRRGASSGPRQPPCQRLRVRAGQLGVAAGGRPSRLSRRHPHRGGRGYGRKLSSPPTRET
jgi:hypothetical protein